MAAGFVDVFRKMLGWWSSTTITTSVGEIAVTNSCRYTLTVNDTARYALVVTEIGDD